MAALLFFCAIHQAVTTFRIDRGWSQHIPAFGVAAISGAVAATAFAILRKRTIAGIHAIVSIVVLTFTFAYFSGKLPAGAIVGEMGRPPELLYWYLGAAALTSAVICWISPERPMESFLLVALILAGPATRVLLRWAPEGFEIAPVALALGAVAHAEFRRGESLQLPPLAKPALAFLGAVLLASIFSTQQQTAWPAFGRTGLQSAAFIAVVLYFRREGGGRRFVWMAAMVATVIAAAELFIFWKFVNLVGFANARLTRLESFGMHPNIAAPFSMVGSLVCVGAFFCARSWIGRGVAILSLIICAASLYLHKSGGATLGFAVGFAAILVCWLAAKSRSKILASISTASLVAAPAILVIAAIILPKFVPRLQGGGESGKVNIATRIEFWPAAAEAMFTNPIVGNGPRNVEAHAIYVKESVEANIDWSNHPHNLLLEIGETIGVPGLLAFLALVAAAGLAARKTFISNSGGDPPLALAGVGVIVGILADGFVDHGFAEFAILPDALWFALAWIAIGAPAPAAAADNVTKLAAPFGSIILSLGTTIFVYFAAASPLVVSELEQSIKWLHFWNNSQAKYETFRDVGGQIGRLEALLKLAPARSDIRLTYANVLLSKEFSSPEEREKCLLASTAEVERAAGDSPFGSQVLQDAGAFYANYPLRDPEKNHKRALELYQRAARLGNPEERAKAHLGVARCLAILNKTDEALEELSISLQMWPTLPITTVGFRPAVDASGQRDIFYGLPGQNRISVKSAIKLGIDKLQPKLTTDFNSTWGPLARLAECYTHISRVDLAIALYQEIAAKAPNERMNLPSALGQAELLAQKYTEALVDIDRAIAAGGNHPIMWSLRARALEGQGKTKEMIEESQKFYDNPCDVLSLRSHIRDAMARLALAKQTASQYVQSAELYSLASRYEDNPVERIKLQINACSAAVRGFRQSQNYGYIDLLCKHFQLAGDWTGELEWGELDKEKLIGLGRELGNACGDKARLAFDTVLDRVGSHPSAGTYWLFLGFGNAASEMTRAVDPKNVDSLNARVSGVRRVALALTARILGIAGF